MAKRKDVAYGFFVTEHLPERTTRQLIAFPFKGLAIQALSSWSRFDPGPIFRITPPKPKRRGRGK